MYRGLTQVLTYRQCRSNELVGWLLAETLRDRSSKAILQVLHWLASSLAAIRSIEFAVDS